MWLINELELGSCLKADIVKVYNFLRKDATFGTGIAKYHDITKI